MKPTAWTRWVLSALGYDPSVDTVDDLFPGSGSVSAALAGGAAADDAFDWEAERIRGWST